MRTIRELEGDGDQALASEAATAPSEADSARSRPWRRLALLAVVLGAAFAVGHATGIHERLTPETLRAALIEAGPWGVALFLVAFAIGTFVQLPGFLFIAAAIFAYDRVWGGVISFAGAVTAVTISFCLVRVIGGRALAQIDRPLLRRALARLDDRPLHTVFWLRMVFWIAPPITYALALSRVRYRDYVVGSALGLLLPIAAFSLLFDCAFALLG